MYKILLSTEATINSYLKTEEKNARLLADSTEIKQLNSAEAVISEAQKSMNFNNVLIIDNHKKIIFSLTNKHLIGKQLTSQDSLLYLSYERAMMSLTPDFSEYGHDPLFKTPTLFISVPIIHDKKCKGILAYECNLQPLSSVTHHYTGLGNSGEIVLAQENDSFITYVAPSRHDRELAFKRKKISIKHPPAIQASILGNQGMGKAIDYRNTPVIGAWTFITKINWGLMVKIDQKEAEESLSLLFYILLLCIACTTLVIVITEWIYNKQITATIESFAHKSFIRHIPASCKNYFFILLLVSLGLLCKSITLYYKEQTSFSDREKQHIITDIKDGAEDINQILKKIAFTTESIADDLQHSRLSKDDIIRRIKRDLSENSNLTAITVAFAPYAYDPQIYLYAPSIQKSNNNFIETMLEDSYDYTSVTPHDSATAWYNNALKQKGVWISPSRDAKGKKIPPTYSYPFFDSNQNIQGVVCVTYKLNAIERITSYTSLDRNGYSMLLSQNGTILAHPIHEFVSSEKTLLDIAQDNNSPSLANIAQTMPHTTSQLSSYTLDNNKNMMWIYSEPITTNNWILAAVFSKEDMFLPAETIRYHLFWILIYCVITILILLAYLRSLQNISFIMFIIGTNIILTTGLLVTWYIVQTTATAKTPYSTVITDQASLDNFLENLQEEAQRKNEEPFIKIPCGLLLYSVGMLQPKEMTISGYLWNKYNLSDTQGISHEMQIPHAIKLIKDQPTTSIHKNWETVTWNIRGTIFQKQNFSLYPFDKQQMQITLEHHDIEKNILLIPDLEDYKKISPEDAPGLDRNFTVAGFNVEKSFFTYKKISPVTNFGFSEYGKTTDHFLLSYNLIIRRNLLNPFVLFFLPLLVVLFSLFSVLLVARQNSSPLSIISGYTGLFFALVILHRSLREQYPTNTTLYMEYAFFFAYISIILLVIHTVLVYLYPHWNYYQKKIFPLIKLLFWPMQLVAWLITTLIIFF